ncbi:MAG: single-stranded DNA-binding protein [Myxococcota bacterium]|nr:single-stranded DNA-binding protein [Myxococcota bacterium]
MTPLVRISRELSKKVSRLSFAEPVAYVYNPLEYARAPHEAYLERFGAKAPREALLLGMNPGPFGMAQTGVPFGDVAMVRDFLGLGGAVGRPAREHPQRPVLGFECKRSEVSGTRFWGYARDRFGSAERFFERFFVVNWCPLVFIEESSRNRTPDKLPAHEREPLFAACDEALVRIVETLQPRLVVGVGGFAERRAHTALGEHAPQAIGCILHPSPASPAANRDWPGQVDVQLRALGL